MKRSTLLLLAKLAFAAGLIWLILYQVGWEAVRDRLQNIHLGTWLLGLMMVFLGTCLSISRWYLLMRSVGLDTTLGTVFRLGWIGVFFNNLVPGLTGGDLVKAFYVTREHPNQRADAVISVVVDRLIGIVALALIAAVIIPFDWQRFGEVALGIYGFLGLALLGSVVVLSRRVKARLRDALGRRPQGEGTSLLGKVDRAISLYRDRLGTVFVALGMSVVVHLLLMVGMWFFGDALAHGGIPGMEAMGPDELAGRQTDLAVLAGLSLADYCAIVPIIMILSSLPVTPAGWGVGEWCFTHFFGTVGVGKADAVALSFTYRLTATLVSLVGGVFLVLDRRRVLEPTSEAPAEPS